MIRSVDESTNEKSPLSVVISYKTMSPTTLSVNEEEMILNNSQLELNYDTGDISHRSDAFTDDFIKMQNKHIDQSKSNKYDYTPLQFAKSLFDRMIADGGGCGGVVASERKNYNQHEYRDPAFNSFVTPDVSLSKRNLPYINIGNENPILHAFKLNSDNLNQSGYQNPNNFSYQETPVNSTKLAQKYLDKLYINGNYVSEFNSEYEATDRNMNSSFINQNSLTIATPNTMPTSFPPPTTTPLDFHCLQRRNLTNVLDEQQQQQQQQQSNENIDFINKSSCRIISPSKLLNLEATINNNNNRMPLKVFSGENLNKYAFENTLINPTTTTNDILDTRRQQQLSTTAKNPLTHSIINRNNRDRDTVTENEIYDQVDAFKNYVISGKVDDNLSLKLTNSNINGVFVNKAPPIDSQHIDAQTNNIPVPTQPHIKSSKRNIFKRLFRKLRHKNRFYSPLTNDTITSLNTQFNRSHLNKTSSEIDTHKKYALNASIMEADSHSMRSHSKSVNFAPSTQSGAGGSAGSLIEEFDRDQQYYDSLKEQANISTKKPSPPPPSSSPKANLSKKNSIKSHHKNSFIGNPTVLTFFIGADEMPFKTEIKLDPTRITLKLIKNVLPKLGKRTKYYFKAENPNNSSGYYKEVSNDNDSVPLFQGQPVCKFFSHG